MVSPRCILVLLFLLSVGLASAKDIVLSPDGPIATPVEARDAARKEPKPVRILVEEGSYFLKEPLQLTEVDSQTIWEAAPESTPVFTGGKTISGWQEVGEGLWKAPVPETRDGGWNFVQLWIDGRRATLARTPNRGYFHLADSCGKEIFPEMKDPEFEAFSLYPEQYKILQDIPQSERTDVLLTVTHAWAVAQCRIAAMHDASSSVRIAGRSRYPFITYEADQRFWMENFRSALDAPGEWFLDRSAGELFYRPLPGEDMTKAQVVAPVTEKMFQIQGAREIRFNGIGFAHSQYLYPDQGLHDGQAAASVGGVIEIEHSSEIHFENCEIAHTGLHAIYFKVGCSDSSVVHCHLHDLGGGGVRIGETNKPDEAGLCHDITIEDCIIQHLGRLHPSACGVLMTHSRNCSVVHCDIGDLFYTGVSIGWNWGYGESLGRENRVENCHIHHLGWAYLSDMGGFYGLGNAPGTVIKGNHVHDVVSHRYGGWGLYTDEGSGDVLLENNLVHDTSESGFHQHYGYANRIRNNIFGFGGKAQIQRSRNETRLSFIYEKNIVVWDPAVPLLDGGEWNWKLNDKAERGDPKDSLIFRNNTYWRTDGKIPDLLTKSHFTWEEWRKLGRDTGSQFADPKFADLTKRDFQMAADSPALKTGFRPWDFGEAGVKRDDPPWRDLAAEGHEYPTWETDAKPWPAPPYRILNQGFENTSIGALGIRGAKWSREDKGENIGVSEDAASPLPLPEGVDHKNSRRSLKVQDAPGLAHSYDPVLDVYPTSWEGGTFRATFDMMAQEGADWFFEMRAKGGNFADGPYVRWQKGKLVANNTNSIALADIPAGEWFRISLNATTRSGKWAVELTRQDGTKQSFPDLVCLPSWDNGGYLLWSALGTTKTAFFIDNLSLEQLP